MAKYSGHFLLKWDERVDYLAVSEHSCIISLKAALDQMADASVVNVHLAALHVEDVVVCEGFIRTEDHLRFPRRHRRTRPAHIDHFPRWLGPNP